MRTVQATYLKFAEYVDILVHIIYIKFQNDRTKDNRYTGSMKIEKNIKKHSEMDFSSLYFFVLQLPSIVRDAGNNLLIQ